MTFFALSCFYFVLTILSFARLCYLDQPPVHSQKPNEPNILRTLLIYLTVSCVFRLLGWVLCTTFYCLDRNQYIERATYEKIMSMGLEAEMKNETFWLPLEPEEVKGINESPVMLVSTILVPEVFV